MLIRAFQPSDACALATLFHTSVREVGSRDYSPEQVAAWSPSKPNPASYLRRAEGRAVFVAVNDEGEPVGYGDLEVDGHIDHLCCRPDVIGTGVGSALCASIETVAKRANLGILTVEASEGARRLFERRGFKVAARNDLMLNGVTTHNYQMSKPIH